MRPSFYTFVCVALLLSACDKSEETEELAGGKPASLSLSENAVLSAEDLASALGIEWAETELRGSEKDSYMIGAALEFGNGKKSEFTGSIGPIPGGTKVKVFSRKNEGRLDVVIVANGTTGRWIGGLRDPFEGTLLSNSCQVIDIDSFLMKGSIVADEGGVNSEASLLNNEAWLRVFYKKQPVAVSAN